MVISIHILTFIPSFIALKQQLCPVIYCCRLLINGAEKAVKPVAIVFLYCLESVL